MIEEFIDVYVDDTGNEAENEKLAMKLVLDEIMKLYNEGSLGVTWRLS